MTDACKVYGPHIAILYVSKRTQSQLGTLGHFFNSSDTVEDKLGLAGASYEMCQSIPAVVEYAGGDDPDAFFDAAAEHEEKLSKILLDFLNGREDVTVCGETTADRHRRVPTVSFTVSGWESNELVQTVEKTTPYAFRWGKFYADRLCDDILKCGKSGVVRVSMVHYNTEAEIHGLVEELRKALDTKK